MGKFKALMDMGKLKIKANSDKICFGLGIIFSVGSVALAVKAGIETPSILEKRRNEIEDIEKTRDDEDRTFEYTEEDAQHDIRRANNNAIISLAKWYGPVLGCTGVAIAFFCKANSIQNNRINDLSIALNGAQAFLSGYRDRVATYVGKEKEEAIFKGMRKESKIDPETGELHETEYMDENVNLMYERIFDDTSKLWKDEAWANQNFLYDTEAYFNRLLQERALYSGVGVVTFNEVLKVLGLPECPEGFTLGWWYSDDHRTEISFGTTKDGRFTNGLAKDVHLAFNLDGDIIRVLRARHIKEIYSF
jgi:hypothetical protein